MNRRKYPQTTGYYCYCHITPDEMFYIGMSKQQPSRRWKPLHYKNNSLGPYIEKYGWNRIRHVILKDGLTKEQAVKLEGLLIEEATRQGFCINKQGSGYKWRDNPKEYKREYNREYDKKRRQTVEYNEYQRKYQHQYRLKKKALKNEEKSQI